MSMKDSLLEMQVHSSLQGFMNCLPSLYTLLSTQIKQYVWPQARFQAEVFGLIPNFFFPFY